MAADVSGGGLWHEPAEEKANYRGTSERRKWKKPAREYQDLAGGRGGAWAFSSFLFLFYVFTYINVLLNIIQLCLCRLFISFVIFGQKTQYNQLCDEWDL